MDKKERKLVIQSDMASLREIIAFHRRNIDELKLELDYMKGHYNKTWEEEYGVESTEEVA